jgi:hypothetical protein
LNGPATAGLQPAREVAPALLSTGVLVDAERDRLVALPDLGELSLGDTVYLLHEGGSTTGLLFARDRLSRTCILSLNLRRPSGNLAWQATVAGVTREGERSIDGLGASFLFQRRQWRETAWSHP